MLWIIIGKKNSPELPFGRRAEVGTTTLRLESNRWFNDAALCTDSGVIDRQNVGEDPRRASTGIGIVIP